MICPKCGTENKKDACFCRKCGFPLEGSSVVSKEKSEKKHTFLIIIISLMIMICIAGIVYFLNPSYSLGSNVSKSSNKNASDTNSNKDSKEQASNRKQADIDEDQIRDLYIEFLLSEGMYNYYSIMDINGDNIPELLAAENTITDFSIDYPEDAILVNYADVYTYQNNEILEAGRVGSKTPLQAGYEAEGLFSTWGGSGYYQEICYKLNEHNVMETWYLTLNLDEGTTAYGLGDQQSEIDSEKEEEIRNLWENTYYVEFIQVYEDTYE